MNSIFSTQTKFWNEILDERKPDEFSKTEILEPFNLYTRIMINSKFPSLINNNNSFQSLYKLDNNEIKENQ
jgi:hypothetical protein